MSLAEPLPLEAYLAQASGWPRAGRHILAHFDDTSVVVYQAFNGSIADEALAEGRFGRAFSRTRMSWIKPNFLWMMYRSGWASKQDQERVLGIRVRREFFDRVLAAAVASSFRRDVHDTRSDWEEALRGSEVRLQWDPDHAPNGAPVDRRAIQLGLRGATLAEYADRAILAIHDMTPLAVAQRSNASPPYRFLRTPVERVYAPSNPEAAAAVGLDALSGRADAEDPR